MSRALLGARSGVSCWDVVPTQPTESRGKWKEGWGQGGGRRGGEGSTRMVKEGGWGQEKGMVEVRKTERRGVEGPGKGWKG